MRAFSRGRGLLFGATIVFGLFLTACVKVPGIDPILGLKSDPENPKVISINEVVAHVKCEIRDSFAGYLGLKNYAWLDKWNAQADLTLMVNDQAAINPGATFTQPLTFGNLPLRVANMGRSASLGLGGGLSTTAARTETVSFSMSLKGIRDDLNNAKAKTLKDEYNDCLPSDNMGLTGNLKLREWVESSLGPVKKRMLTAGDHKSPKPPGGAAGAAGTIKPAATPVGGAATAFVATGLQILEKMDQNNNDKLDTIEKDLGNQIEKTLPQLKNRNFDSRMRSDSQAFINKNLGDRNLSEDDRNKFAQLQNYLTRISMQKEIEDIKMELKPIDENITRLKGLQDSAKMFKDAIDNLDKGPDTSNKKTMIAQLQKQIDQLSPQIDKTENDLSKELATIIWTLQQACDCDFVQADPDVAMDEDQKKTKKWFSDLLTCMKTIQSMVQQMIPPKKPSLDPPIDAISHQVQFIIAFNASANPTWTLVHFKGPSPSAGSFASLGQTDTHTLTIVVGEPSSQAVVNTRSALTFSANLGAQLQQLLPPLGAQ